MDPVASRELGLGARTDGTDPDARDGGAAPPDPVTLDPVTPDPVTPDPVTPDPVTLGDVLDGLGQILWLLRPDGSIERFNAAWTARTGLPAVMDGLGWAEAFHPDDRARLVAARTAGQASGLPYEVEARMRMVDGAYRHHRCRVAPLRRGGAVHAWIGTAVDVEDLRAAEARQRALVDLGDRLRDLGDPGEIAAAGAAAIGEALGLARAGYAAVEDGPGGGPAGGVAAIAHDWVASPGLRRSPGRYPVSEWGTYLDPLARGETVAVEDVERDPRTAAAAAGWREWGVRSAAFVPLMSRDGLVAFVFLHGAAPRTWTEDEIAFIRDVADRIWAAMRRAEADSELRGRDAALGSRLDAIPQMVWSTLPDGHHDFFNDRWYEFTGVPRGATDGEGWAGMFHPEDRERAWARWRHSLATGEPYEVEYRLRHASGAHRWVLGRALPIRDPEGRITRWMGTCTDIDALKSTEDELRRASALLRLIGDSTPDLIYAKDRRSRILYANAAVRSALGLSAEEIAGRSDLDWAADRAEAEAIVANDRRVMETGETVDVDEAFTGPDGRTRHFRSVKSPLRDATGAVVGLVGVTSDMTERRRAEERERLLAREVDHRAKNLLAVVQSVVQLTRAEDVGAFAAAVTGRIRSLARAHSLLAASRWEGADLMRLVAEELAPFAERDAARVGIEGPAIRLRPEAAQALALVVHELATNAAKYGALSVEGGRVEVSWALVGTGAEGGEEAGARDGTGRLELSWRELGGPRVAPPTRHGFGSTVVRATVEKQLRGAVALDWLPEGLACGLSIPSEQVAGAEEPAGPGRRRAARPAGGAADLRGRRVLVVENEALIAVQVAAALDGAGCEVLGPAARIVDALDLLYGGGADAALLDVDVAGEPSFAIADVLAAKRIPFAFVTGFDAGSALPERFRDVPVIAKPFDAAELVGAVRRLGRGPGA
jgi:PAS domain S-box-containing protein